MYVFEFLDKDIIPVILLIIFSIISIKGLIQKKLLSHIGIKISWKDSILLYYSGLSMLLTPGGSGLIIKSYFLKRMKNTEIKKSVPFVVAERFYDLLADLIIISVTLIFFQTIEAFITLILFIPIISIFLYTIKKGFLTSTLENFLKKIPIIKNRIKIEPEFVNNLSVFFSKKIFILMTPVILTITFYESIMFYLSFNAFNIELHFFQIIQIFYSSLLLGIISFIPAGTGPFEVIFANMVHREGVDLSILASLIIFIRLMTTWIPSGVGFIIAYIKFLK